MANAYMVLAARGGERVKLTLTNSWVYISGIYPRASVERVCSLIEKRYIGGTRAYKAQVKKGLKVSPYKDFSHSFLFDNKFPTGWINNVLDMLENSGVDYEIEDQRDTGEKVFWNGRWSSKWKEVEHQEETIKTLDDCERGIIQLGTGAGKTYVYARLVERKQRRALIIVPSKILLHQTFEVMNDIYPGACGRIGDNHKDFDAELIIAIPNSLVRNEEECKKLKTGLLINDECHRMSLSGERIYFNAAQSINAYYRYCFSGTVPDKNDNSRKLCEAVSGRNLLVDQGMKELADIGWLRRPRLEIHKIKLSSSWYWKNTIDAFGNEVRTLDASYHTIKKTQIEMHKERNDLIAYLAEQFAKEGKTVLIATDRVESQGEELRSRLGGLCEVAYGTTKKNPEKIESLRERDCKILITTIAREGVDIPSLDVIIRAYGGEDAENIIQLAGRVVRQSSEKEDCVIVDFLDLDGSILEGHSKTRIKIYRREGIVEREN